MTDKVQKTSLKPLNPVTLEPLKEGWRWLKLREVCSVHPGQHILEADYNRKGIGIGYLTGPDDFGKESPNVTKWTEKSKAWCEPSDVLVTVKGAGVGKTNLAPNERVAIGRQLMAVRPNPGQIDHIFLYHVLITCFSKLQGSALGSTVPGLGRGNIESLEFPCPPLLEQKRIATKIQEFMREVERARNACEKQLEAAKALTAAYLREVFESEEAKNWGKKRLREVCEKPTYGYTASAEGKPVGPKFLRITDIQNGKVNWDTVPYCRCSDDEVNKYLLKPGDILFARTGGTIGKSYLIKEAPPKTIFASYLIRVRTGNDLLPEYLYLLLQTDMYWEQVKINKRGGAQPNMNAILLSNIFFPLPPIPAQKHIALELNKKMSQLESLQSVIQNQQSALSALPQAILRQAFNGEL